MIKKENNFVFIDNQNLFAELKRCGWDLDYARFIVYLREKYSAQRVFLFVGYLEEKLPFYEKLFDFGYEFIFKPTIRTADGVKGNCDADLIMHAMRQLDQFDNAIIITSDGDFYCLVEYLAFKNKLKKLIIPNKERYSSLLKKFRDQSDYLNDYRDRFCFQKKSPDKDGTL